MNPLTISIVIDQVLNIIRKVGTSAEEGKRIWNELKAIWPDLPERTTEQIAQIMSDGWDDTAARNLAFDLRLAADREAGAAEPPVPEADQDQPDLPLDDLGNPEPPDLGERPPHQDE